MRIIKTKNYEEMTNKAIIWFLSILEQNKEKKRINVSITGGKAQNYFMKI